MGRNRKVARNVLLSAAQQVVVGRGAAHLTLDAVANDAGVSKASVLYDYKSKGALVHALVTHGLEAENARVEQVRRLLDGTEDSGIRARIALTARRRPSVDDRSAAVAIISALGCDPELKEIGRACVRETVDDITKTARNPRAALLALLALEGLRHLEYLDLHHWSCEEFAAILADIAWLPGQQLPDDPPPPDALPPDALLSDDPSGSSAMQPLSPP